MTYPVRYLDTETTGFSNRDKVVEITILDENGKVLLDTLVNPGRSIPAESTAVHGITNADVRNAPTWAQIERKVIAFLTGCELVGHNIAFDLRFLGAAKEAPALVTCTMKAWRRHHGKSIKLGVAAAAIGFTPSGAFHRSAADTEVTRALHLWLKANTTVFDPPKPKIAARSASSDMDQSVGAADSLPIASAKPASLASSQPAVICCSPDDPRLKAPPAELCPPPTLRGTPWTLQADELLLSLWNSGRDILDILAEVPRTPLALFMRLERLGAIPVGAHPYNQK